MPSATQINSNTPLTPTIHAWKIFLDDQGRSIHTIKAFIADVNLLAQYVSPDQTLGGVTTKELNNFLEWMQNGRGVPCSPKTLARRITSIKSFFRWLHNNGVILIDPAEKVVQRSVISPLPAVLSPEELAAVLAAADKHRTAEQPDARPAALLHILLDTAIKKGELLALTTNHLELDGPNAPFVFIRYASPQNRYKERKIALSETWVTIYEEYGGQYDLSEKLFPWSPRRLEYLLEDLGKEAGIENQLSFLMCRWTSALEDYRNNVDHNKIRQKLGISKIQWREIKMKLGKLAQK